MTRTEKLVTQYNRVVVSSCIVFQVAINLRDDCPFYAVLLWVPFIMPICSCLPLLLFPHDHCFVTPPAPPPLLLHPPLPLPLSLSPPIDRQTQPQILFREESVSLMYICHSYSHISNLPFPIIQQPDQVYRGDLTDLYSTFSWITDKCIPLVREITFQNGEVWNVSVWCFNPWTLTLLWTRTGDDRAGDPPLNLVLSPRPYRGEGSLQDPSHGWTQGSERCVYV